MKTSAHPDALRITQDEILASAGVDLSVRAELERERIRVLRDAMNATKIERVTYQGEVTDVFEDIDHATRLAGGAGVARLNGTEQSKSASDKGPSGPTQVNVYIAGLNGPMQAQAEVIEAEPVTAQ